MVELGLLVKKLEFINDRLVCTRLNGATFEIDMFTQIDVNDLGRKALVYSSNSLYNDDVTLIEEGSTLFKVRGEVERLEHGRQVITRNRNVTDFIQIPDFISGTVYNKGDLVMYNGLPCVINDSDELGNPIAITGLSISYTHNDEDVEEISKNMIGVCVKDTNSIHHKRGTEIIATSITNNPIYSEHRPIPQTSTQFLLFTESKGVYVYLNKLYDIETSNVLLENVKLISKYLNVLTVLYLDGKIKQFRVGDYKNEIFSLDTGFDANTIISLSSYVHVIVLFHGATKQLSFLYKGSTLIALMLPSYIEQCFYDDEHIYYIENQILKREPIKINIKAFDSSFIFSKPSCKNSFSHLLAYYSTTYQTIDNFRATFKGSDNSLITDIATDNDGNIYAITGSKLFKIQQNNPEFELQNFSIALESPEDVNNATAIEFSDNSIYVSFSSSKILKRYSLDTLTFLGNIPKQVNGVEIRTMSRGQTNQIAVTTDTKTTYIYQSLSDVDNVGTFDCSNAITDSSRVAPLASDGVWVTETTPIDHNVYKVNGATGLVEPFVKIPSNVNKALTIIGDKLLTLDLDANGRLATYQSYIQTIRE